MQRHKLRFSYYTTAQTVSLSTAGGYYFGLSIVSPYTGRNLKPMDVSACECRYIHITPARITRDGFRFSRAVKRGFGAAIFKTPSAIRCLFVIDSCPPTGRQFTLDESPECITLPVKDLLRPTLQTSNKFARSLFNDRQRFSFRTRGAQFLRAASQKRRANAHISRGNIWLR